MERKEFVCVCVFTALIQSKDKNSDIALEP